MNDWSPLLHAQSEVVAKTEVCLDGPQYEIGEGVTCYKYKKKDIYTVTLIKQAETIQLLRYHKDK